MNLRDSLRIGLAAIAISVPALAADEPNSITPVAATTSTAGSTVTDGSLTLPKTIVDAKAAYAKTRDYSGHLVKQERVDGKLLPEQSGEIRVRTAPFCIHVKMLLPKDVSGWEATFLTGVGAKEDRFKFRPAGVAGADGLKMMKPTDPKAMTGQRHSITDTGIGAILERVEKIVATEQKAKNNVQIVAAEYTFQKRPAMKYEIFCERAHPLRYAPRCVVYFDTETKLPVRFEAYDAPKPGVPGGELLECISFVNLKFNAGLGESAFDQ